MLTLGITGLRRVQTIHKTSFQRFVSYMVYQQTSAE
jgi:hypothetical protein